MARAAEEEAHPGIVGSLFVCCGGIIGGRLGLRKHGPVTTPPAGLPGPLSQSFINCFVFTVSMDKGLSTGSAP